MTYQLEVLVRAELFHRNLRVDLTFERVELTSAHPQSEGALDNLWPDSVRFR